MNLIFLSLIFSFINSAFSQDNTWRGLKIEKENRCSPYNRTADYGYSQEIENQIIKTLGHKVYSPYSGKYFESKEQTDIEHIVSLSEAHDSGLCSADKKTRNKFASDIKNLTLASPEVNRDEKSGFDASGWLPEKNKCWFANKVIEIKKAYSLTVDSEELIALEKVISGCSSFEIVFFEPAKEKSKQYNLASLSGPNVKKSRSGICHSKETSPYYSMTRHYQSYQNIQSCISSGGRCPKRDFECQKNTSDKRKSYKKRVISNVKTTQSVKANIPQTTPSQTSEPNVKKSKSGICHGKSSSSYSRTKNFTAYESLESCLNSGGRCPKRDSVCNGLKSSH